MKLTLKNESQPTKLSEVPRHRWYQNVIMGHLYFPMGSCYLVVFKNGQIDCFGWSSGSGNCIDVVPYINTVQLTWVK